MKYKCYFDGSCEPQNPGGNMGIGVHVIGNDGSYSASKFYPASPDNTNNVAEYLAFTKLLNLLKKKQGETIEIFGDSQLVVKQMNKEWQIKKGTYKEHAIMAQALLEELKKNNNITITWIPREENSLADGLSKKNILE